MTCYFLVCVTNKTIEMTKELKKYTDILARECKEFREKMEKEVNAFFPFQLDREQQDLNQV